MLRGEHDLCMGTLGQCFLAECMQWACGSLLLARACVRGLALRGRLLLTRDTPTIAYRARQLFLHFLDHFA